MSECGSTRVRITHDIGERRTFSALARSGTCACAMNIFESGLLSSPPSRLSPTMPMICRGCSAANSRMTPLPITSRSLSGSAPFFQNSLAIASLMMTTGGPALLSRSLNVRPRLIGILKTRSSRATR